MFFPDSKQQPVFAGLVALVLIGIAALEGMVVATKAREYRVIGSQPVQRTLTVSGIGKVRAAPDLGTLSAGVQVEAPTASEAQTKGNEKMATVIAALKRAGIAEKDLQSSNYSVHPRYEYVPRAPRQFKGYEASQNVEIRIRDLDRVNAVFDALRESDATNVGSLQLNIDDPEVYRTQARTDAIADARVRAEEIARALGVRLGPATNFNESSNGYTPPIFLERSMAIGGAPEEKADIQTGENEIRVDVSVTYAME